MPAAPAVVCRLSANLPTISPLRSQRVSKQSNWKLTSDCEQVFISGSTCIQLANGILCIVCIALFKPTPSRKARVEGFLKHLLDCLLFWKCQCIVQKDPNSRNIHKSTCDLQENRELTLRLIQPKQQLNVRSYHGPILYPSSHSVSQSTAWS